MIAHDLLSFSALLLAGVLGALIAGPLGNAAKLIAERARISDHRRR
jgi:hypothetical protein